MRGCRLLFSSRAKLLRCSLLVSRRTVGSGAVLLVAEVDIRGVGSARNTLVKALVGRAGQPWETGKPSN